MAFRKDFPRAVCWPLTSKSAGQGMLKARRYKTIIICLQSRFAFRLVRLTVPCGSALFTTASSWRGRSRLCVDGHNGPLDRPETFLRRKILSATVGLCGAAGWDAATERYRLQNYCSGILTDPIELQGAEPLRL